VSVAVQILDQRRHELNNIFGKILGAAELAMDQPCGEQLRLELETIARLAEEGGALVNAEPDATLAG
jgi:hypothetical protein